MAFDVEGALKVGTEKEVAEYLAKTHNFDITSARKENISDREIIDRLASMPQPSQQTTLASIPEQKDELIPAAYGIPMGVVGAGYGAGIEGAKGARNVARWFKTQMERDAALGLRPETAAPPGLKVSPGQVDPTSFQKYGTAMHGGLYTPVQDMSTIYRTGEEVAKFKQANPTWTVLEGTGLAVPPLSKEQAAIEAAQKRTAAARAKAALSGLAHSKPVAAAQVVGGIAAPGYGAYQLGSQGAQAYNRLGGETAREKAAGVTNLLGAGSGALAFSRNPRVRYPAVLASGALGALADLIAGQPEEKAAGGAIPGYAGGGLAYLSKGKKVMEAFEYGGKQLGKLSDWAQDYIGSYFVPTQSDRMRYVGGPSFSANQLARPEYKNIVWGSGKPGTATGIANLAKDPRFGGVENQIFAPLLGEAKMHQSNKMIFDRMVEEFFRNPEKLTPELRQTINDYIRSGGLTVGGAKKSKSFEPIPDFDVADRQMIENLGKTFDNRKLIAQHAFGGEGIGGRKSQIIPYEKILQETTDPTVLGAPTFSMGPRAFKLTGETLDVPRPDLNAAFPYKLFGQDLGVTYPPVPSELSLMDFQRQWRQDTGKTLPRKSGALPQPGYYEHTVGYTPAGSSERIYPRQKMTENWVKELQRSGFNQGGLTE